MPRTRSLALSELRIGALTVAAVTIAAAVILMLSGRGGFFWQRYSLKSRFAEVPGLSVGAPVRVAGVEAGSVTRIDLVGADVEVVFEISRALQSRITTASTASIGSESLLGQSTLDVAPSLEGQPIPEWGYVKSGRAVGRLGDVTDRANEGLAELTELLKGIRQGEGTVGRLFTDDELYRRLQEVLAASHDVVADLRSGKGTAGRLMSDPSVYDNLDSSLRSFNALLARLEAGQGSIGKLMTDDRFATSITAASRNAEEVTGRLNRGEGTAGKLLTDTALYDRVTSLADRLDRLVAQMNEGQGTAGQLLRDRQLYENMNGAAAEIRALVSEIRKNPRKYLSVKMSLF